MTFRVSDEWIKDTKTSDLKDSLAYWVDEISKIINDKKVYFESQDKLLGFYDNRKRVDEEIDNREQNLKRLKRSKKNGAGTGSKKHTR